MRSLLSTHPVLSQHARLIRLALRLGLLAVLIACTTPCAESATGPLGTGGMTVAWR
jgi:hypothetical protein